MAVTQVMPREQARYAGAVPSYVDVVFLSVPNSDEGYNPPAGCRFIRVIATANVYISNGTAAIPVAAVVDGTASALIFAGQERYFRVSPSEALSFIAPAAAIVTIECYENTFESLGA
jgi:hypothetical protein